MKIKQTLNILLVSSLLAACAVTNPFMATAPVYENTKANEQAVFFAPEILSKDKFEINALFNKAGDKLIFARCTDDFKHCTMMESQYQDGQWQAANKLPFSGDYLDADPYFSPGYDYLYYVSKKPLPGTTVATENVNLWRVAYDGKNWGTPEYLPALNSPENDLYPTLTTNGDLYFPSFRNNQRQMYVAKSNGSGFEAPQALPTHIYGDRGLIGDTVVLPDGNTIIFSMRRSDSAGKGDLYVSRKVSGQWTVAKSLGDKVNTPDHEFTPIVSPDGQYLFFTRIENGKGNVYQIAMSAVGL